MIKPDSQVKDTRIVESESNDGGQGTRMLLAVKLCRPGYSNLCRYMT
jgi:hypothetical protein